MRNDLIELLALLVSVGYIKSFRVTKNYIYVTMKNDRQSSQRGKRGRQIKPAYTKTSLSYYRHSGRRKSRPK